MYKFFFPFAISVLLGISCQPKQPVSYYIDSLSGNDQNSGLSTEKAWKTANNLAGVMFSPGDRISFRGNQEHRGPLEMSNINGKAGMPVIITSYGEGKAMIDAENSSGIIAKNCEYLEIRNIKVRGSGRLNGNYGNGIQLNGCRFSKVDSVDVTGFMWSGLNVVGGSYIEITRVYAADNGFCGILAESGEKEYGDDGSKFKTLRNVRIAYSVAENNPGCPLIKDNHSGNGILLGGVVNGVVEHCEAMNNGWDMPREGNGPVGIWAYMSDSVTIQYCYSHHNKTSPKGKDGGGFDFDGGMTNSVMRYNIAAFNEGAGYGIFQYAGATTWEKNEMHHNISYHDGSKNGQCGIFMWCDPAAVPMKNFRAYNNTLVGKHDFAVNFEPGKYENFTFMDNIFLLTGLAEKFIGGSFSLAEFRNNIYWSNYQGSHPTVEYDSSPKTFDPEVVLPKSESDLEPEIGNFYSFPFFQLNGNSKAIGSGTANKNIADFWDKLSFNNIGVDTHTQKIEN